MHDTHGLYGHHSGALKQPEGHHLAQFNWAQLRHDPNDPRVAEFIDNVARMNYIAERMPGYVWRHLDDRKALSKLKHPGTFKRTKRFTTTLSVWADVKSLENFAFHTVHDRFYRKKADWFLPHSKPYIVFWFVPVGQLPTIAEAVERADHLLAQGDSEFAFGWDWARKTA